MILKPQINIVSSIMNTNTDFFVCIGILDILSILFPFIPGSVIVWDYFLRLYEWSNIESISICKKLTNEHMYPNDRLKMRNHLAEEVLDEEMLQNFKVNIYYYTTKCYQLTTSKSSLSVVTLSRRK